MRDQVSAKAEEIVESFLKPEHVKPPPTEPRFNYITDIFTKWRGRFFYFIGKYACPGPNALTPSLEIGFGRLEYTREGRFNLAYFRHTGQWWEIYSDLLLEEALDLVRQGAHFHP